MKEDDQPHRYNPRHLSKVPYEEISKKCRYFKRTISETKS